MNSEFLNALDEIEKGKNISKDILLNAIDAALVSAYKRNYNTNHSNVVVNIDRESGEIKVFKQKEVVETVEDDFTQISVDEAKSISGTYELGDLVNIEEKPADFGRIAAQTAKQVVMQRIKEAERTLIYDEFSEKEHKIVTGVVGRIDIDHLYLPVVSGLQELQHLQIVALDVQILGGIPVYAFLRAGTQRAGRALLRQL